MTWIATEGYGLYPAPETLGFVPMLGTPTETRICSPTWLCGGWMKPSTGGSSVPGGVWLHTSITSKVVWMAVDEAPEKSGDTETRVSD